LVNPIAILWALNYSALQTPGTHLSVSLLIRHERLPQPISGSFLRSTCVYRNSSSQPWQLEYLLM